MWELKFDDGTNVELGSKILDDKGRPGTVATVKFFKSGAILVGCDNGLQVKRDKGDLRPIRKPDLLANLLSDIDFCTTRGFLKFAAPCIYFNGNYDNNLDCSDCRAAKINLLFTERGIAVDGSCVQKMLVDIKNRIESTCVSA